MFHHSCSGSIGMQGTLEEWEADLLDLITFDHGTSAAGQTAMAEQPKKLLGLIPASATTFMNFVTRAAIDSAWLIPEDSVGDSNRGRK